MPFTYQTLTDHLSPLSQRGLGGFDSELFFGSEWKKLYMGAEFTSQTLRVEESGEDAKTGKENKLTKEELDALHDTKDEDNEKKGDLTDDSIQEHIQEFKKQKIDAAKDEILKHLGVQELPELVQNEIAKFEAALDKVATIDTDLNSINSLISNLETAVNLAKLQANPDSPEPIKENTKTPEGILNVAAAWIIDENGKLSLNKGFEAELERHMDKDLATALSSKFTEKDLQSEEQQNVLIEMVRIIHAAKTPETFKSDSLPIQEAVKEGIKIDELDELKREVEQKVAGEQTNESKKVISTKIDELIDSGSNTFLSIADAVFGRDLLRKVLGENGMLGTIARMIAKSFGKFDIDENKLKQIPTRDTAAKNLLDSLKKNDELYPLKENIQQPASKFKDAKIQFLFKDTISEDQISGDIENKKVGNLLRDVNGRFENRIQEGSGTFKTLGEDKEKSITFKTNSYTEANIIAHFYGPQSNGGGLDIKGLISSWKSGKKSEKNMKDEAKGITEKIKKNDPYSSQKEGLPNQIIADVTGTEVTLTWTKMDLMERIQETISRTTEEEKKTPQTGVATAKPKEEK